MRYCRILNILNTLHVEHLILFAKNVTYTYSFFYLKEHY